MGVVLVVVFVVGVLVSVGFVVLVTVSDCG